MMEWCDEGCGCDYDPGSPECRECVAVMEAEMKSLAEWTPESDDNTD